MQLANNGAGTGRSFTNNATDPDVGASAGNLIFLFRLTPTPGIIDFLNPLSLRSIAYMFKIKFTYGAWLSFKYIKSQTIFQPSFLQTAFNLT